MKFRLIIDCILTGFMKKMQCNALNIKTVAKQVWFYFIHGTTRPGYAGTNLQIVLNTPKNPYLNQATQKNTCQNFPTQKKSRNRKFQAPQTLRSSLSLEVRSTTPLQVLFISIFVKKWNLGRIFFPTKSNELPQSLGCL